MGCFNVSCAVSHITINEGERVFLFPLLPNISNYEIKRGHPDDGSVIIGPCSMFLDINELYNPFCFPIEGIYNDYGSIGDIVENENTKAIEEFLGISIREFVELVTENRGKNAYDHCSQYYEKFFDRKELMDDDVSFQDFLMGIGFEFSGDFYRYPGSNYRISIRGAGDKKEYRLVPDAEAETRMKQYMSYMADGQLKLRDGYNLKKDLLELHEFMTGSTIGLIQCNTLEVVRKLSAMFVHGDIYDQLAKPVHKLVENPEEIKVSSYLLQKLGFKKEGNDYLKDNILVKHDDYSTSISKGNITIRTTYCRDFIDAYEKLSGYKCDLSDISDYDNKMFLFRDMRLHYKSAKDFFQSLPYHSFRVSSDEDNDTNRPYWLNGICGLMTFKEWKYFIPIYLKKIEDGSIESEYVRFMRFHYKMYQVNAIFAPTYQGVQCGDPEAEKELLETAVKIVNNKFKMEEV